MRNEFSQDGNRRDVYVRTRYSRRKGRQEVFQERELFARLNGRGSSKRGGGRLPSRYIDRRLRSAIPHFKGKISVYSGRLLSHGIIRRSSPRGYQLRWKITWPFARGRSPGSSAERSCPSLPSPLSFPLEISACSGSWAHTAESDRRNSPILNLSARNTCPPWYSTRYPTSSGSFCP